MLKPIIATLALAVAAAASAATPAPATSLWYEAPPQVWTYALPIGNSQMGAMVYGTPATETISLNEETFWSAAPHDNNNKTGINHLQEIRDLIFADKFKEAQDLIDKEYRTRANGMRYLPLGDLKLTFDVHDCYTAYQRGLDLADVAARAPAHILHPSPTFK